jgi:excisionase family DNA binding protein
LSLITKEVSTAEAAKILGVSKDTVLKLKEAGLLEYRNMAPPGSSRPVFAFTLPSVMELRTSYERDEPTPRLPKEASRRQVRKKTAYKHLNLDD